MSSQPNHCRTGYVYQPPTGTRPSQTGPRRRLSKAIPIVNPNPLTPPAPPIPPIPRTIAKPRVNPGYLHLKKIIKEFDKEALPASAGDLHFYALSGTNGTPKDIYVNSMQDKRHGFLGQDERRVTRMDPHRHVLNFVFLPYRCDTSTCLERFQAFFNTITPDEWERMAKWKQKIETNFNEMRDTTNNLGSDAAVSRAMKKWFEGMTGISLDTVCAIKYVEGYGAHVPGQIYTLDPSAHYRENMRMPVYYSPPHYYSGHIPSHIGYDAGFVNTENLGNVYHPPRTPQSISVPRSMPTVRPQTRTRRPVGVFATKPLPFPPHATSLTNFEWEGSTNLIHGRKLGPKQLWVPPSNRLDVIPGRQHQNRIPQYTPIPNPSGRKTPPHQRSPKWNNSTTSVSNLSNTTKSPAVMYHWIEGSKNEVAKCVVKKWADENNPATEKQKWNSSHFQSSPGLAKVNLLIADLKEAAAHPALPTLPLTGFFTVGEEKLRSFTRPIERKAIQKEPREVLKDKNIIPTLEETSINDTQTLGLITIRDRQNPSPEKLEDLGERRDYARAVSGSNQNNENQKHPATLPVLTNPNKEPTAMLASEFDTQAIKKTHINLNYAKAVSGVDGRIEESKEVSRVPALRPIPSDTTAVIKKPWENTANWRNNDSRANSECTPESISHRGPRVLTHSNSSTTFPNKKTESSESSAPAKGPLQVNPISPSSGKSWSSIVTGRMDDTSPRYHQRGPVNIETLEYPELGSPLRTRPSSHLSTTQHSQSGTYLSAQAKAFEPTGSRHNFPVDPYRNATNTTNPPPFPTHNPLARMNSSPIPPDSLNAYYPDPLLEIFFNTPQLIEYWGKSYDNLLFHQNRLKVQFQRIENVFHDEWDMITAEQRRAIVSKAVSNLDGKLDKVQLWDIPNMEKMLFDLGLSSPRFRANRYGNWSEYNSPSYLRDRADYCFDLDPDAFASSPYWLFNMIGLLLGTQLPLKYSAAASPSQTDSSIPNSANSSCADDCSECMDFSDENRSSNSRSESPIPECFLDEIDSTVRSENYKPLIDKGTKESTPEQLYSNSSKKSYMSHPTNHAQGRKPLHIDFMSVPRLMSNRFQDSVFKPRHKEWISLNPGRARFMKIIEIDITLFYCEFVEEILHIFGEIRRERVWYTLPTIWDFFNGPASSSQSKNQLREGRLRARNSYRSAHPRERSMSCPTWGCKELSQLNRHNRWVQSPGKLAEAKRAVDRERMRVHNFVRETQRTADWAIAGLKLVERETDREVERAWDGGLWSIPMPSEEINALRNEFARSRIWRAKN